MTNKSCPETVQKKICTLHTAGDSHFLSSIRKEKRG